MHAHRPSRSSLLACAAFTLGACATAGAPARQATFGGQELSAPLEAVAAQPASAPALAAEPRGTKGYLALCAGLERPSLVVKRWEGDTLSALGGAIEGGRSCVAASLRLDGAGAPVVAFEDRDASGSRIEVRRWDGAAWQPVGAALNLEPAERAEAPALALGKEGTPWVAWQESRGDAAVVLVARHDGKAWRPVGGSLNGTPGPAGTGAPALVIDAQGLPVVAWQDGESHTVRVSRYDGDDWRDMGKPLNERGASTGRVPALTVDPAGHLLAAFVQERGGERTVPVLRWDGRAWGEVGEPLAAGGAAPAASRPALATDRWGIPAVIFPRGGPAPALLLSRWTGDGWSDSAQPVDAGAGTAAIPALGIIGDGTFLMGWQERADPAPSRVLLRRGSPAPQAVAPAYRPPAEAAEGPAEEQR
ncbi:MAG TPA: hypothetical protein VFE30_11045 [Anaeromyxobacteraceae bacterium]|jgi:hypothetical protein|nr:hypothetical protein [Anaeromyxobacteraceae bacterium]